MIVMEYNYSHLICFSPTHSSHLIGESILREIRTELWEETDLTYEEPHQQLTIRDAVAIVVVPVYAGRVAETALERMKNICGENSIAIPVVVYGNRDYDDALLELTDWCRQHGFMPFAAAAFIGEHSYSRPDRPIAANRPHDEDLRIAQHFGRKIYERLCNLSHLPRQFSLTVKGHFPYKEKKPASLQTPLTLEEKCIECGFCLEICPVQAIRLEGKIVSDPSACIKCCACVKQCPQQARVFDTPYTDLLFQNFSTPREPELFFAE